MKGGLYLKITSAVLAVSFAVSVFFIAEPQVHAQAGCAASAVSSFLGKSALSKVLGSVVPVGDSQVQISSGGQFIAKCVLTPIAIKMARTMARNISNSIVNWINNDFKGKPGFVTDFNGLVSDSADEVIGGFIYGSDLKFLCQPFAFKIRLALATKYQQPFKEQIRCSLTDITNNVSGFAKSNGGAGWNHWLEITTQPQNNEYGAYLMADSQLAQNIQGSLNKVNDMLNRNGGFLDFQTCDRYETDAEMKARVESGGTFQSQANDVLKKNNSTFGSGNSSALNSFSYGANSVGNGQGVLKNTTGQAYSASDLPGFASSIESKKKCLQYSTKTPGKLVAAQAEKVLGGWSEQLNLATDIDQIVGALISHFADKMITGTQGFLGLSSPGGYAKQNLTYSQAAALAADQSNPDNTGLADANASAGTELAQLFPTTQVTLGTNLATGKSVTESSAGVGSSAFATDGDTSTSAATAETSNPWIEVDLGSSVAINEIHVWGPAGKSVADSIGTFDVVVSNSSGNRDFVSDQATLAAGSPNPTVVSVNKTARYIRIERFNNSYSCNEDPETGSSQTCYRPLDIAEIEAIAPNAPTIQMSSEAPTKPTITVGPATGATTVAKGSRASFEIPIDSDIDASVSFVEVRLYAGSNPVAFGSVFSNGSVGIRQRGSTTNNFPGGAPGVDFANISAGPTSHSAIVISGTTLAPSTSNTYKLVITARDSAKAALGTETINFVVQ